MNNRFLLFLLFTFSYQIAGAQFVAKKVPMSKRKTAIQLSNFLCESLESDSAKVMAITAWMANNIIYDFKYAGKGYWGVRDNKPLVKRKKAICSEYATLFQQLSDAQDIKSAIVSGYSRTINYVPYEQLIKADHAWNIVFINGEWRPLDVTWSAGYLKKKSQWLRHLLYLSLKIPYHYRYKFMKHPNNKFVLIDPKEFAETHLPLQPYWQLLHDTVPMRVFEADTVQKYTNRHDTLKGEFYNYEEKINQYTFLSDLEKSIISAKVAHRFNPRNYRILGFGYSEYATELAKEVKNSDSIHLQIKALDSSNMMYDSSIYFFDAYKQELKDILKKRNDQNNWFKDYILTEDKLLIKTIKSNYRTVDKKIRSYNKDQKKRIRDNKKLKIADNSSKKRSLKSIVRPYGTTKEKNEKIRIIKNEIDVINDQLKTLSYYSYAPHSDSIRARAIEMDSINFELINNLYTNIQLIEYLKDNHFNFDASNKGFFDSLKLEVHCYVFHHQSRAIMTNSYSDSIFSSISVMYDQIFKNVDLLKDKLKLIEKLKKASADNLNEDELYTATKEDLRNVYNTLIGVNNTAQKIDEVYSKQEDGFKRPTIKSKNLLEDEIEVERSRHAFIKKSHKEDYKRYAWHCEHYKKESKRRIKKQQVKIKELVKLLPVEE